MRNGVFTTLTLCCLGGLVVIAQTPGTTGGLDIDLFITQIRDVNK